MTRNRLQKFTYSLLTVVITVAAFVFYSCYVVEGITWNEIHNNGGLYMFGTYLPIWVIYLIECICALFPL